MSTDFAIVLIGDSDIDRWPASLFPDAAFHAAAAFSGATLVECVPIAQDAIRQGLSRDLNHVFVVACAGENDIAQSIPLAESCNSMEMLITSVFASEQDRLHLIFLGPKLEPWLNDDKESLRDYIRMSQAFERTCTNHALAKHISCVDCLLMFCGDSARLKGALLGCKAKAERRFFDYDLLHLNSTGYAVWKQTVDEIINSILRRQDL